MSGDPDHLWRAEVKERFQSFREQLTDSTALAGETRDELREFIRRVEPTLSVTEPMLRGAAIIGRTVEFLSRWGSRFGKFALFSFACWLALKAMIGGSGWNEAVRVFVETLKWRD